jgi:uncharacterized membrane protein YtjA (UPF0391 family)
MPGLAQVGQAEACRTITGLTQPRQETRPSPKLWAAVVHLQSERLIMLYWTLIFLVIAIVAAVLGFGGVAVAAAGIAKILFFIFLVLFLISLVTHLTRRSPPI